MNPRCGPFLLAAIGAVLCAIPIAGLEQPASSAAHTVVIRQMRFDPHGVSVKAGDTVQWKNEDIFTHTVTANDSSFDSGSIEPGQSWTSRFNVPGVFGYHCRPHPNMTAQLAVVAAGEAEQHSGVVPASKASLKWLPPHSPEEFHPILVNFTAALLPLALLSDVLGRVFRRASLHNAGWWMTLYAAVITPLTAAAGWWWKHAAGPDLPANLIIVHQWLGTTIAVLFIVLVCWRWMIKKRGNIPGLAYLVTELVVVLALVYQGSLGGKMLFGK
ncbi:MAG: DUF2231 domain-containing protein [Acidobacteriaceae bacterium]